MDQEPFKWTRKRELGAQLLAESMYNKKEIAAQVGVSDVALRMWEKHPEFKARVQELAEEFKKRVQEEGIALLSNRIRNYNQRWRRLNQVIEERATDPQVQDVPGGKSGMLVHHVKSIGTGESAYAVDEYEVDTGLSCEMRKLEEQIARELGQWADKSDITTKGGPLRFVIEGLGNAQWLPGSVKQEASA